MFRRIFDMGRFDLTQWISRKVIVVYGGDG